MLNAPEGRWWKKVRLDAVLLIVAIVAGVGGAILSVRLLGARAAAVEASLRDRYEPVSVVVAAQDLGAGESLEAARLAVRKMPKEFLPADAVSAERAGDILGAHTAISISRGTPVLRTALRRGAPPPRLASILEADQRALTIAVDQVNAQAGNLQPGDWVDLYYSRNAQGDAVLVPLLQHIEVLAAGATMLDGGNSRTPEADRSFSTITLRLSGNDAARVLLAQQAGSVSVLLRAPGDTTQLAAEVRSSRELLARPAKASGKPVDTRVELLVGGGGGLVPERSWLSVGQARAAAARAGDAS